MIAEKKDNKNKFPIINFNLDYGLTSDEMKHSESKMEGRTQESISISYEFKSIFYFIKS